MSSAEKSIGQAKGQGRSTSPATFLTRARAKDPNVAIRERAPYRGDSTGRFSKRYAMALQNYVLHPEEVFLQMAYELGRQAVAEGTGLLNLLRIHNEAVGQHPEAAAAVETFFMEALSPFEATHRGFRETNAKLSELNATLAKRNNQMAATNFELKQEIEERKRTEEALRQSKEHYRVLFNEARGMQENLRHLSNRILHIQEDERKRISRELHDEIGQALTAVNVHLAVARKSPAQSDRQLSAGQELLEQTMAAVHRFALELRPAMIDDLGLAPTLRSYIKTFSERTELPVRFEATPMVEDLGGDEKMVLYRVIQEGLTNVARHAQATAVDLTIRATRVAVRLELSDNGKAFSAQHAQAEQKRLGLLGMQERVRLVNGTFHIDSREGRGTTLRVDLPLPREKEKERKA